MKSTISKLLEAYENGKMSRRDLVQGLALLAASSTTVSYTHLTLPTILLV